MLLVPHNLKRATAATLSQRLKVLTHPRLLLVYLITILGYDGTFTVFTYLAPILQEVSGFVDNTVSLIMQVYGPSVAFGNINGGKMADRMGAIRALTLILSGLVAILMVLTLSNPCGSRGTDYADLACLRLR